MLDALDAIQGVKVAVVGDVMLDRYVHGTVERISPEAPVPIFRQTGKCEEMLGGAGNTAANLAALGAEVALFGSLGGDPSVERKIQNLATEAGVQFNYRVFPDDPPIVKERYVAAGQQIIRMDHGIGLGACNVPIKSKFDAVVVSDYDKGVVTNGLLNDLVDAYGEQPIILDPCAHRRDYRGITVLTPNEKEAAVLRSFGGLGGVKYVALTQGSQGIRLLSEGGEQHFPARPRQVFDVAGAGDTVTAVIGACLGARVDIKIACRLANEAAGLVVEKSGTATVTAEELWLALGGSLLSADHAAILVNRWRANNQKVALANGVFDLLHPGHLHLLRSAKEKCDRLVVALNSDESAARLKPGRPIQDLGSRAEVISALHCVDAVVSFDETSPLSLIERIRPDLLAKGGDYRQERVVGHGVAEVLIVPLIEEYSTTRTVNRMRVA